METKSEEATTVKTTRVFEPPTLRTLVGNSTPEQMSIMLEEVRREGENDAESYKDATVDMKAIIIERIMRRDKFYCDLRALIHRLKVKKEWYVEDGTEDWEVLTMLIPRQMTTDCAFSSYSLIFEKVSGAPYVGFEHPRHFQACKVAEKMYRYLLTHPEIETISFSDLLDRMRQFERNYDTQIHAWE